MVVIGHKKFKGDLHFDSQKHIGTTTLLLVGPGNTNRSHEANGSKSVQETELLRASFSLIHRLGKQS